MVVSTFLLVDADQLLSETSDARTRWRVFRDRAAEGPERKALVLGASRHDLRRVEHPEVTAERPPRVAGPDRIIIGADRGFGSFPGFGTVDPNIACSEPGALAADAALAKTRA